MSVITRESKGSILTHEELDANFIELQVKAAAALQEASDAVAKLLLVYTKDEVEDRIQAIVGGAPDALDTLQEIAAQLQNNESAVGAITAAIAQKADKSVVDAQAVTLAGKADKASENVFSATQEFSKGVVQSSANIAGNNIDLKEGSLFNKTIAAAITLTVSNVPVAGKVGSFILNLTNGGAFAVTWWPGIKWASGTAPTLTASGRDVLGFFTNDGGATWTGVLIVADSK